MSRLFWKVANGFFPEYSRMKKHIGHYTSLSREEAARESRESLYQYLNYCRTYSPYWRERWPAHARNFTPQEAEEVLRLLPALNKEDLRQHRAALRIRSEDRRPGDGFPPIGRQKEVRTGGTTGVPVVIFQDDYNDHRGRATIDFYYTLCGLVPGTPFFYVWGSNNELSDLSSTWRKRVSSSLRGIRQIPAFGLTPDKVRNLSKQIAENPKIQSAMFFVSALDSFLSEVEREGLEVRRLQRVLTGGGLLHSELKRKAKEYLADEVFDVYGTRDFGLIACDTPSNDGLNVASWQHHVEVLDANGQLTQRGQAGQVHVTAFCNYSFALIRAATGDTAEWYPASDNDSLPVPKLKSLRGRTAEHLRGPGDVIIDPSAVIHMIGVLIAPPWLRKFQLRQYSPMRFELHVESWEDHLPKETIDELRDRVEAGLSKLVNAAVVVEVVQVDTIPASPSGKHLYCVQIN